MRPRSRFEQIGLALYDQPAPVRRASQERSGSGGIPAKAGLAAGDDLAKPERPGSDRDRHARRRPRRKCGRPARAGLSAGKGFVGNDRQDGDLAPAPGRAGPRTRALAESDDDRRGRAFKTRGSARPTWSKATSTPPAAIIEQALDANPDLFEAHYCLAVLEQDAGHARPAHEQAVLALKAAPDDTGRSAARAIAAGVARFARRSAGEDGPANSATNTSLTAFAAAFKPGRRPCEEAWRGRPSSLRTAISALRR